MKTKYLFALSLILIFSAQLVNINNIVSAQEETEEEWDYEGVIRVDSELRRVPFYEHEELDQTIPMISDLSNATYEVNVTGNIIKWYPNDPYPSNYPDNYTIYKNEEIEKGGNWESKKFIEVEIDNLELGVYEYKIIIQDEKGNLAEDSLYINVLDDTTPYIAELPDMEIFEGEKEILEWEVTDKNLSTFSILLDERPTPIDTGEWNTTEWNEDNPIAYSLANLEIGEHNLTLVVEDETGKTSTDTVIITVQSTEEQIDYEQYPKNTVDMGIIGLDTDSDESMDTYIGYYGMMAFQEAEDYYDDILHPILLAEWRFKIPENSSAYWDVLYWPNPLYEKVRDFLRWDAPVFYVNLTKEEGVNLKYEIDFGTNTTFGNFTTYGPENPLLPEYPEYPGFKFALPLETGNRENIITATSDFFGSLTSALSITLVSFITLYIFHKRRKQTKVS